MHQGGIWVQHLFICATPSTHCKLPKTSVYVRIIYILKLFITTSSVKIDFAVANRQETMAQLHQWGAVPIQIPI